MATTAAGVIAPNINNSNNKKAEAQPV